MWDLVSRVCWKGFHKGCLAGAIILQASLAWAAPVAHPPSAGFNFDDYLLVPLRVHLLTARDQPEIETVLRNEDIHRILAKVNRVWAQAGLHFYLESLVREEAACQERGTASLTFRDRDQLLRLRPSASRADGMFHLYYLKEMGHNGIFFCEGMFVKETASLREVEGGLDEPLPRVTSHELGHALGLTHLQNRTNLMASGTTGFWLTVDEVAQARAAAAKLEWVEPAPRLLKRADDLYRRRNLKEAANLYGRLAGIPVQGRQVRLARKRANG